MNSMKRAFCALGGLLVLSGCGPRPSPSTPPLSKIEQCVMDAQQTIFGADAKSETGDDEYESRIMTASQQNGTLILGVSVENGELGIVSVTVKKNAGEKGPYVREFNLQEDRGKVITYSVGPYSPELVSQAHKYYKIWSNALTRACAVTAFVGSKFAPKSAAHGSVLIDDYNHSAWLLNDSVKTALNSPRTAISLRLTR